MGMVRHGWQMGTGPLYAISSASPISSSSSVMPATCLSSMRSGSPMDRDHWAPVYEFLQRDVDGGWGSIWSPQSHRGGQWHGETGCHPHPRGRVPTPASHDWTTPAVVHRPYLGGWRD